MPFTIRDDHSMARAMSAVFEEEYSLFADGVRFASWPPYQVTIKGQSFAGGMPTRVMPAFVQLQLALHRAYARERYGDERAVLTAEERERTELVVRLTPGSTTFGADLLPILEILAGNLSSTTSLVALLGLAAIYRGNDYLKTILNYRASARQRDQGPTDTITQLAEVSEDFRQLRDDVEHAHRALIGSLNDDDELLLDKQTRINGSEARRLTRRRRRRRERARVNGRYVVDRVQSGLNRDGFRVRVRELPSDRILDLPFPEGSLSEDHIGRLQQSEWRKTPLNMSIQVERIGARIVKAELIRLF